MAENDDTRMNERPAGGAGFDDDRLLAFALGLADDPELVAAAAGDAELRRRLEAMRADVRAVSDGVNAAVPAPDDSYTDLSQERWRGLAPYLQGRRPGRQPRRPRAFFHRALAPAAALLLVAAVLGGVLTLSHHGKSRPPPARWRPRAATAVRRRRRQECDRRNTHGVSGPARHTGS